MRLLPLVKVLRSLFVLAHGYDENYSFLLAVTNGTMTYD